MKKIIAILFFSLCFKATSAQIESLIIIDDTLFAVNMLTGQRVQLNKTDTTIFLTADVSNANVTANTIADVTGLSFNVNAGSVYSFKFFIVYTSAATTTGSRWSINGPATTYLNYNSSYTLTATSITNNQGLASYNVPSGANASSLSSNNIAIIEGVIKPSANGTVIARFASEITVSAITAKANQSWVYFKKIQ